VKARVHTSAESKSDRRDDRADHIDPRISRLTADAQSGDLAPELLRSISSRESVRMGSRWYSEMLRAHVILGNLPGELGAVVHDNPFDGPMTDSS